MKHLHTIGGGTEEHKIPEAEGASLCGLISEGDGVPNFTMLVLTIAPEGHTPYHQHSWEEEIFITSGEGKLATREGETSSSSPPARSTSSQTRGKRIFILSASFPTGRGGEVQQ
jgi:hypothetical protein